MWGLSDWTNCRFGTDPGRLGGVRMIGRLVQVLMALERRDRKILHCGLDCQ